MLKKWFSWMLALLIAASALPARAAHTREQVRVRYASLPSAEVLVLSQPDLASGAAGQLTAEAAQGMLEYARFMRWLAGVEEPLALDDEYADLAQAGAALLAVCDTAAHELPQPEGFPDALYEMASRGIGGSNIAAINWMDGGVLQTAIEFFQRDEGSRNRFALGHRRWLLSPALQRTGFGLANADSGMTYVTMYVHDFTAETVSHWERIAWPAEGAFPAEYIYTDTPWCVILNPDVYAVPEDGLCITVSCAETGESFVMTRLAQEDAADAYWVNAEAYGLGVALIFRPQPTAEFEQNQRWRVQIEGLRRIDGEMETLEYEVDMMSLEPIPVRLIELSASSLSLRPGEAALLSASVVPGWADDLSIQWSSTDETVATVDANGGVRALSEGQCAIVAQGADGQSAECALSVSAGD